MTKIEHNGRVLETKHFIDISDEKCQEIINDFNRKPTLEEVRENLIKFHSGSNNIKHITDYFFRPLMNKCKLYHSKWSIADVLESYDLIRYFYAKTKSNENFFSPDTPDYKNIEAVLRTNAKGVAGRISNFKTNIVQEVLDVYNVNNNYYDPSCGWGVRMMTSMRNNVNYYGTDPNTELNKKLNEFDSFYRQDFNLSCSTNIKCHGSEVFVPEWVNKMGLVFTSPPYFGLEDYKFGDQSYIEDMEYDSWLNNFMSPTFDNIIAYMIDEGVCVINIKGYKDYNLYEDTLEVAKSKGLFLIEEIPYKNIKRSTGNSKEEKTLDTDEKMMVLRKINSKKIVTHNSIEDLFD